VGGDVGCPVGAYPGRTVHGMWGEGAVFGVPLEVALGMLRIRAAVVASIVVRLPFY